MKDLFSPEKATQIVSYLLKLNSGTQNYTKLIKLIYIADRESYSCIGLPITFDQYVSMDNGPVVSQIYDLIKSKESNEYWSNYIWNSGYNLKLKGEPGEDFLSANDLKILKEINDRFKDYDYSEMITYCHKMMKEWKDPNGSSIDIKLDEIFKEIGKSNDEIIEIKEDLAYLKLRNDLFGTSV